MNNIYYLAHGGPGSGRYPLGSGDRPYQKYETSRKGSGGILGYIRNRKAKKAAAKQQKETEQQKKSAEQLKREYEAEKERVLREGSATEVLKYKGKISNQELQAAVTRLNLESQLRNLSEREVKSALDKVDNIMRTVKTGTEWAKIGSETYNTFANIYNATPEGQAHPLTLVGQRRN